MSSAITAIGSYLTYPAFQVLQLSIRLLFESNLSLVSTIYWRRLTFLTALPQHRTTVTCNARRPLRRVRSCGQSFFLRRNVVISEGGIGIETGNGEWPPAHGQIGRGRGHECRGENSNCFDDHRRSAGVLEECNITTNQFTD